LYWLTLPPAVFESPFLYASSPTFVVGGILTGSYSNRGEVES
jgi:hypothetical protein